MSTPPFESTHPPHKLSHTHPSMHLHAQPPPSEDLPERGRIGWLPAVALAPPAEAVAVLQVKQLVWAWGGAGWEGAAVAWRVQPGGARTMHGRVTACPMCGR